VTRDARLLASFETDGRLAIDDAGLRMARFSDPDNRQKPPPLTVAAASYFIPRLGGYPKWFVVSGTQTTKGAARLPLMMVLVQERAGAARQLSTSVLPQKDDMYRDPLRLKHDDRAEGLLAELEGGPDGNHGWA
jgi:hypothetical protein